MALKVLVIRSEEGKIVESRVVEGDFFQVVKDVTGEAYREWEPASSDFIVMRDFIEAEVDLPLDPQLFDFLREYGELAKSGSGKASIVFPFFTISFDNRMVDQENFIDRKVYVVAPYVNDDIRAELEAEAVRTTAPRGSPSGIQEV